MSRRSKLFRRAVRRHYKNTQLSEREKLLDYAEEVLGRRPPEQSLYDLEVNRIQKYISDSMKSFIGRLIGN